MIASPPSPGVLRSAYIDCSEFVHALLPPEEWASAQGLVVHIGDPTPEQLRDRLAGCVAALNGHTAMDRRLLLDCPALRSIVFLGTGASSYIDLDAAEECGIRVRTVPGYGNRSVAEHAFTLILSAARRVAQMDRALRAGEWSPLSGVELEGKTLGIIGMGGIGRALARIAHGFGMQVLAWNRRPLAADTAYQPARLDDLLRRSDVVSLHMALTEETRGFLSADRLRLMPAHAILVNTARGGLVDEAALMSMLQRGLLAHAALDVFATEPLPHGHAFAALENVTLTAHAGFKTPEASRRLAGMALDLLRADLARLARGEALPA
jgi:D-3-phosphoglycerate dehydrogenase